MYDTQTDEQRRQQARLRHQRLKKRKLRIQRLKRIAVIVFAVILLIAGVLSIRTCRNKNAQTTGSEYEKHPEWKEDFLEENAYSRPGTPLRKVNSIFVHYTANPGTTAKQNRDYFNNLAVTKERFASSHFIIGYEGEIIQCVPLDEMAYAVKERNGDSISIECCHLAEDGSFTEATYQSLIKLLQWLTDVYDLEKDDILRHYDSNGKLCPLYYVEHEDAWKQLKEDVLAK